MKNYLVLFMLGVFTLISCDRDKDDLDGQQSELSAQEISDSELEQKMKEIEEQLQSTITEGKSITWQGKTYNAGYGYDPLARTSTGETVRQVKYPVFINEGDVIDTKAEGVSYRMVDVVENYNGVRDHFRKLDTLSLAIGQTTVPKATPTPDQKPDPGTTGGNGTIPPVGGTTSGKSLNTKNGIQTPIFNFGIDFRNEVIKDLKTSDTIITLLASVKVYDKAYSMPGILINPPNPFDPNDTGNLQPACKNLLSSAIQYGPERVMPYFVQYFGPFFASGIVKGGEIVYKMELSTKDMTDFEKRDFAQKVKFGIGSLFNISLGQELTELTKKTIRERTLSVKAYSNVRGYSVPPISVDNAEQDVYNAEQGLINHIRQNPLDAAIISLIPGNYDAFLDLYEIFNGQPNVNPFFDQQAQKIDLVLKDAYRKEIKCYTDWDEWKALEASALSVISTSDNPAKVNAAQGALGNIRANIANSRDNCAGSNTPDRAQFANWLN